MARAVMIHRSALDGTDIVRAISRDVARYTTGDCESTQGCCRSFTCVIRTLTDGCFYTGPPPTCYPRRVHAIEDILFNLRSAVEQGVWHHDADLHHGTVQTIYSMMGQTVPILIQRALDLPASIMHSPVLVSSPRRETMHQQPLMLTTATGQPLSPLSSRPIITAQNGVTVAFDTGEFDTSEVDIELQDQPVGHAMDPSSVERAFREANNTDVTPPTRMSPLGSRNPGDELMDM